jgi:type II secretory pathway pseudopilin PulG
MANANRTRRGSTLIELIVSIGVLIPVIVVAVGIFPYASVTNARAAALLAAYDFASAQLESARNVNWQDMPQSGTASTVANNITYQSTLTVTPYFANDPAPTLLRLQVIVTWQTRQPERLELDTIVARVKHPATI